MKKRAWIFLFSSLLLLPSCHSPAIESTGTSSSLSGGSPVSSTLSAEPESSAQGTTSSGTEASASSATDSHPDRGFYELCEGLYVSHLPGIYDGPLSLEFQITRAGCTLFYTFDGDAENDEDMTPYTAPIPLSRIESDDPEDFPLTTSVDAILASDTEGRCISYTYINNIQNTGRYVLSPKQNVLTIRFRDAQADADLLCRSLTYIIDEDADSYQIPIVSLSMPYGSYFGEDGFYNRIREDIAKRVHLEYIDPVYDEYFYRNSQIKLGGNWSLGYPQRTLNLNFNKDETGSKNTPLSEHVFAERKRQDTSGRLTSLTRFRLHNGGNCFEDYTGFNDAVLQMLMTGTGVATTGYRPCIAYLNGEYWGVYSIREHYADVYFQQNYGVDKDDVILYELKGDLIFDDGDKKHAAECLDSLLAYLNNDFTDDEVYQTFIETYIDVDSLIDLFVAESYAGNWDFVGNFNNLKLWRTATVDPSNPYSDGRWRFALHDADFAFTDYGNYLDRNSPYAYTNFPLFGKLMQNRQFRDRFYLRAEALLSSNLSALNATRVLNAMVDEIMPYKMASAKRWGQTDEFFTTWMNNVNGTFAYFKYRSENYLFDLNKTLDSYE